jgi:aryl-alcohol dehydrogenase-like predicted oxidoreductase
MLQRNLETTRPLIAALEEIGARHEATVAQVALNWLIHFHDKVVVTIPGATTARQAKENAGAMNFKLSDDEMARLDELSRNYR